MANTFKFAGAHHALLRGRPRATAGLERARPVTPQKRVPWRPPRTRTPLQVNLAGPRARRERTEPRRDQRARAGAGAGPLPGARSAHLPGLVARRRPTAAAAAATAGKAAGPTTRAARGGARPGCGGTLFSGSDLRSAGRGGCRGSCWKSSSCAGSGAPRLRACRASLSFLFH